MAACAWLRLLACCSIVLLCANSGTARGPEGAGGFPRAAGEEEEEEDVASLTERSGQIIRLQDAEEGQMGMAAPTFEATGDRYTLCLKPRAPANGYIQGRSFDDGGQVHVRCNETYHLIGPSELTCIPVPDPHAKHGIWLPEDPYECIKYNNTLCFIPDPPAHGYIMGDKFEDGDKVQIVCDEGYKLNGPSDIMCVPVSVPNATHGLWVPQTNYTCTPNEQTETITEGGEGEMAETRDDEQKEQTGTLYENSASDIRIPYKEHSHQGFDSMCSRPSAPTNGRMDLGDDDLQLGGKVGILCDAGYTLRGPAELTCSLVQYPAGTPALWLPQAVWLPHEIYACLPDDNDEVSADQPESEAMMTIADNIQLEDNSFCGEPHPPENGYIEGASFDLGAKVHVRCEEGYTLIGPQELTCGAISCQMCGHVLWTPQDEYTCTRSLSALETNMVEIEPMDSNRWDGHGPLYSVLTSQDRNNQPAQLRKIDAPGVRCPAPTPPEHGRLDGKDYTLYSTVDIVCEPGYTLIGQSQITCLPAPDPFHHVGVWEPEEMATCKANPPSLLPWHLGGPEDLPKATGRQRPDTDLHSSQIEGLPPLCSLPKVIGPCKAAFPRFYFDQKHMECLPFTYGGCRGNDNNFETFEECQHACR